jgi:hypothetical protein
MKLTGLHLLLTYQCTFECDHCFVWGSPWQSGTMTLALIDQALAQAREAGSIEWIFFEGGEPFLYYPILLKGASKAREMGFQVGIVSNSYWATSEEDALEWLRPFENLVEDLSISSDLFHYDDTTCQQAKFASAAAEKLGIPIGVISIAQPSEAVEGHQTGQLPPGTSRVMYRGRATEKLIPKAALQSWSQFTNCPEEDLVEPGRVHLDPIGYLHICQGISIGNIHQSTLKEICAAYNPASHPIVDALLAGGPAELVRRYELPHSENYADACHLCYQARLLLRSQFASLLTPDQMYGVNIQ